MHPFEVFYDVESSKYYLFLPDGSVMVDGVNCECEKRGSDLNVELDISADSLPEKIYGHVTAKFTKEDDGTIKIGECKVSFDGESEISPSDPDSIRVFNFAVTSFGAAENDGNQYDILTSAINFSLGDGIGKIEKCECVPQKPDQISLNRMEEKDGAAETGSTWQIMGFCKFKDSEEKEHGSFVGDEDETIDPYGEQKNFAVISRQEEGCEGEWKDEGEEEVKSYRVAYKKLAVKLPAPFTYKRVQTASGETDKDEEWKYTIVLENPYLFIDGKEYRAIFDGGLIGEGEQELWLVCTRESKDSNWYCQVVVKSKGSVSEGGSEEGGVGGEEEKGDDKEVINVKLYELRDGKVVVDYRAAFINLTSKKEEKEAQEIKTDGVSIDFVEEEDENKEEGEGEDEKERKLQISHFADGEMDSTKGLFSRAKVDKETGEITTEDEGLMLIARKNGKVIYVPLGGKGADPGEEPEEEKPEQGDPCDHDKLGGSAGGVSANSGIAQGGVNANGEIGVPAGGDSHTGDDDCNCERK